MEKEDIRYQTYVQILKEELIPAMGCTEPIAISYCAAKARAVLGCIPEDCLVEASGNIIKNVKSVVVPNTDGLKGIEAAAAAGIVAGKEERILEVISAVTQDQKKEIRKYLDQKRIRVKPLETEELLDIVIQVHGGGHKVKVRIAGYHSNIVRIEKDGDILYEIGGTAAKEGANQADRNLLNVKDIVEFADTADIRDVQEILDRQIEYNSAISEEGLRNPWGANVGKVLLNAYGNDIRVRARAAAAAASDAAGVQSCCNSSENRDGEIVGLLRSGQRRMRSRVRDRLSAGRRFSLHCPYPGQRARDRLRDRLRRGKAVLRGQDCIRSGRGNPGIRDVLPGAAVPRRRRDSFQGSGEYDPECGPSGGRGDEGDG